MKKICSTLFLLVPFFLSGITVAQGLKFGIGGGLSAFSNGNSNYSYSAGAHVGVKLKLDIPMVPITPIGFVNYHFLSGKYSYSGLSATYTQKILSYGVGAEYTLLPGLVRPYLAVDFGINNIGEGSLSTPIGTYKTEPSKTRSGIDIGVGTEIKIP